MTKQDRYQHRRHNKNLLMVHLIFVAKYRKKLFFGSFHNDVKQYLHEACVKHQWYVKQIETDKDHVHILLQYNPTDSITNIVSCLKQYSTYKARRHYGSWLQQYYWKEKTLWSDGFLPHQSDKCHKQQLNTTLKIKADSGM